MILASINFACLSFSRLYILFRYVVWNNSLVLNDGYTLESPVGF